MNLKEKYYSPTPKNLRILGDLFLILIPVVQTTIGAAPNLDEVTKYWIGAACTLGLVMAKFTTNLFTEKPKEL
jgi:hypothetical protein